MPPLLLSFSAFCFVVTMAMHVAARLGTLPGNDTLSAFMLACFLVGFAAFYLHPDRKRDDPLLIYPWRTFWRFPLWLKIALAALFVYLVVFCEAYGVPHRWSIGSAPLSPLLAQASALVLAWLFAVSTAMAYDARRMGRLPPEPGP